MTGLSIGTIVRAEKTGLITAKNQKLITQKLNDYAATIAIRNNDRSGAYSPNVF